MEKLKASTVFFDVQDMDRAVHFYTEILGLPLKVRFQNNWAEVDAGSISIGLHPTDDGEAVETGGGGVVSFYVSNAEKVRAHLMEKGCDVTAIRNPPRGKFFMLKDPDGNYLHLIEFNNEWKKEMGYQAGDNDL